MLHALGWKLWFFKRTRAPASQYLFLKHYSHAHKKSGFCPIWIKYWGFWATSVFYRLCGFPVASWVWLKVANFWKKLCSCHMFHVLTIIRKLQKFTTLTDLNEMLRVFRYKWFLQIVRISSCYIIFIVSCEFKKRDVHLTKMPYFWTAIHKLPKIRITPDFNKMLKGCSYKCLLCVVPISSCFLRLVESCKLFYIWKWKLSKKRRAAAKTLNLFVCCTSLQKIRILSDLNGILRA